MNTRKLVSALCAPRLWLACAAVGVLGLAGCSSDSGSKPDAADARRDVPIGGGGGSPGMDGKVAEAGPGTGGKGGSIDAAGGAPGIDGAAGAVRLDGGGTGGVAIDGGKGTGGRTPGTGGVRIDGGGGAGGSKLDVAPADVRDAPPRLDVVNRDLPITPDTASCGVLGAACCANQTCTQSGTSCQNGRCRACGGDTEPCCAGSACAAGGCCVPSSTTTSGTECVVAGSSCTIRGGSSIGGVCGGGACASDAGACGALNDPCCRSNNTYRCTASNVVCTGATGGSAGKCTACGRSGQACCSGDTCTQAGAECNSDGICELCGAANQACCGGAGGDCNSGLGCTPVDGGSACKPCGEATQPCCGPDGDRYCATVMLVCIESGSGTRATTQCDPCGASGQRCCTGRLCNGNMSCTGTGDTGRCQ